MGGPTEPRAVTTRTEAPPAAGTTTGLPYRALLAAALVPAVLLLAAVVRLPWAGDLGMHAAVVERLRADLLHPGHPLVDADVPSPYYSPWMVLLALLASATGASAPAVLHLAAFAGLVAFGTGLRAFVRTLTDRRAAVPLALLCVLLLYGTRLFAWSGVPGLTSLALTVAYPSTLALGLALHLWALLRRAAAERWGTVRFLGLGLLLALVLLVHQFTGAVALLGVMAVLLGARPWPPRAVWARAGAGAVLAGAVLAAWPYYSFSALSGADGLDGIHRPLYEHLASKFCLVGLGVVALGARWWRDRRDPLALLFVLGLAVFAAGGLSAHWSWGRILPAVLLPAQLALAVEAAGAAGRRAGPAVAAVTASALLAGACVQAGAVAYALPARAARAVRAHVPSIAPWPSFAWAARPVPAGATVMTDDYYALRMLPAYGPYTVAPAYPDVFLPDVRERWEATRRYYAPSATRAQRLGALREYGARWVLQKDGGPGLPSDDPALRRAARGPGGLMLLEVER
ncbi:hypothetical protein [Streptomyces sp. I05A-00742]|uniref:hypothetical protein n=1 Tax=Streptomyces sp. I05A-00742 TaxID=2732853 RepID=UPI001488AFC6|nr:hypothetical protein [Streptomyces sp. I05A-00742]